MTIKRQEELRGIDQENYTRLLKQIEGKFHSYPSDGTRDEKWEFYSDLDDSYRQPWLVDGILDWLWHPNLILTGQFGEYVVERIEELGIKKDYLLFNGRLREGVKPTILKENHEVRDFWKDGFVPTWLLLDDSHYSGRTRLILETYMQKHRDYPITNTVVVYNGCPRWHPQVNALYSWYMVHGLDLDGDFKVRREW